MSNTNLTRGNQPVVIGAKTKTGKDVSVFESVLRLPSLKAPNKYTVPATHYKLVLRDAGELKATVGRMMSFRASNDAYQHVQMRQDVERNILYLWHDASRTKQERNLNKPFAGEDEPVDSIGT